MTICMLKETPFLFKFSSCMPFALVHSGKVHAGPPLSTPNETISLSLSLRVRKQQRQEQQNVDR